MSYLTNNIASKIFLIIVACSFSFCKSDLTDRQQCIETSNKLLNYFKSKDTNAIANLIGTDLNTAEKNMSFIYSDCEQVGKLLNIYGIPPKDSFEFSAYPNDFINRYTVSILIKDSVSNKNEFKIDVFFAPKDIIPLTKIRNYEALPALENLNLSPPINN